MSEMELRDVINVKEYRRLIRMGWRLIKTTKGSDQRLHWLVERPKKQTTKAEGETR